MPARCSLDSAAGDVSDFFVFVCARATRPSSPGSQPRRTEKEGDAGARPYQVVLPAANGVSGRDLLPIKADVGATPRSSWFRQI